MLKKFYYATKKQIFFFFFLQIIHCLDKSKNIPVFHSRGGLETLKAKHRHLQVAALLLCHVRCLLLLLPPFPSFLQFIILDEQKLQASISEEYNKRLDANMGRVLVLIFMALKYLQVALQFHALYEQQEWQSWYGFVCFKLASGRS